MNNTRARLVFFSFWPFAKTFTKIFLPSAGGWLARVSLRELFKRSGAIFDSNRSFLCKKKRAKRKRKWNDIHAIVSVSLVVFVIIFLALHLSVHCRRRCIHNHRVCIVWCTLLFQICFLIGPSQMQKQHRPK